MEEQKRKAAEVVKSAILSDAAASAGSPKVVLSPEVPPPQAPTVETLVREATGTLRKATVTLNGDLKEDLVDKATTILTDKAEVIQVTQLLALYAKKDVDQMRIFILQILDAFH